MRLALRERGGTIVPKAISKTCKVSTGPTAQPNNQPPSQLRTVDDLAERWRVARKTLRNKLSSGELDDLPRIKIFGRVRFSLDDIVAYERTHRVSKRGNV